MGGRVFVQVRVRKKSELWTWKRVSAHLWLEDVELKDIKSGVSSRWSLSRRNLLRTTDQMPIVKTHPTLVSNYQANNEF